MEKMIIRLLEKMKKLDQDQIAGLLGLSSNFEVMVSLRELQNAQIVEIVPTPLEVGSQQKYQIKPQYKKRSAYCDLNS